MHDTSDTVVHLFGAGALLSGRVATGMASHFLFQVVYGNGIARFISSLQGRGLDVVFDPVKREYELVTSMGGYASYGHAWKKDLISYFTAGSINVVNKDFQPDSAFNFSAYVSDNLFWDVTVGTRAGIEYAHGTREDKGGASGTANRLSFIYYHDF